MKFLKNQRICRAVCLMLCAVMTLGVCVGIFAVSGAAADSSYKNMKLIPGGVPFGVKFNTDGVVVIGFCDIDEMPKSQNPAYAAGLRPKDVIVAVDGKRISDSGDLIKIIEASGGKKVDIVFRRGESEKSISITPVFSKSENKFKTGIWVRDSGAGIGTVTYIDPETREFGGLGHGICDGESGELIPMSRGIVSDVKISKIKKGGT